MYVNHQSPASHSKPRAKLAHFGACLADRGCGIVVVMACLVLPEAREHHPLRQSALAPGFAVFKFSPRDFLSGGFALSPSGEDERMRYGDTRGHRRTRRGGGKGRKDRFHVSTAETFSGKGRNMRAESQGPTSIFDPWICGKPFAGLWQGDDTQVEEVTAGITELSRIAPWASGAALPPATTRRAKANVALWDQVG